MDCRTTSGPLKRWHLLLLLLLVDHHLVLVASVDHVRILLMLLLMVTTSSTVIDGDDGGRRLRQVDVLGRRPVHAHLIHRVGGHKFAAIERLGPGKAELLEDGGAPAAN